MEHTMSIVPVIGPVRTIDRGSTTVRPLSFAMTLVGHAGQWIAREIRVRRDMRRLAEFDDSMLRDVGIARADIEGAVRRGHDGAPQL